MHVARWVVYQVGVCHQGSVDQREHDPRGPDRNSLKGIDRGIGGEGLSLSQLLENTMEEAVMAWCHPQCYNQSLSEGKKKS